MKDIHRREIISKISTKIVLPISLLLGIYVILHGHLSPGGGFQGGVIIGSAIIIYYIGYGKEEISKRFNLNKFSILEEFSALAFILLAFLGVIYGVSFFTNVLNKGGLYEVFSSGTIFFMNFAVGFKVLCGVSVLLIVMLTILRKEEEDDN